VARIREQGQRPRDETAHGLGYQRDRGQSDGKQQPARLAIVARSRGRRNAVRVVRVGVTAMIVVVVRSLE
jgi:hypothetical protein